MVPFFNGKGPEAPFLKLTEHLKVLIFGDDWYLTFKCFLDLVEVGGSLEIKYVVFLETEPETFPPLASISSLSALRFLKWLKEPVTTNVLPSRRRFFLPFPFLPECHPVCPEYLPVHCTPRSAVCTTSPRLLHECCQFLP